MPFPHRDARPGIGWAIGLLLFQLGLAAAAPVPLPAWVEKAVAERRESQSRDVIEESTYDGRRVYEVISGYRFDTGDEHVLFDEDGYYQACEVAELIERPQVIAQ